MMKMNFNSIAVAAIALTLVGPAFAAEITNDDATAHMVQITENGERSELVIDPGQTVIACEGGCFMTAPNGDLLAIEGGESITLIEGAAVVQ